MMATCARPGPVQAGGGGGVGVPCQGPHSQGQKLCRTGSHLGARSSHSLGSRLCSSRGQLVARGQRLGASSAGWEPLQRTRRAWAEAAASLAGSWGGMQAGLAHAWVTVTLASWPSPPDSGRASGAGHHLGECVAHGLGGSFCRSRGQLVARGERHTARSRRRGLRAQTPGRRAWRRRTRARPGDAVWRCHAQPASASRCRAPESHTGLLGCRHSACRDRPAQQ